MAATGPIYIRGSNLHPNSYYEERLVGKRFFYYINGRYQLVEVYRKNGGRRARPTVAIRNLTDGQHIAYPEVSTLYRASILEEDDHRSELTSLMACAAMSSYWSTSSNRPKDESSPSIISDSDDSASDSS